MPPASLPGHTFAVTNGGLAVTVNNLRQREVVAGVPRMVLTRAILEYSNASLLIRGSDLLLFDDPADP